MNAFKNLFIMAIWVCLASGHAFANDFYEPDIKSMNTDFRNLDAIEMKLEQQPGLDLPSVMASLQLDPQKIGFNMPVDTTKKLGQFISKIDPLSFGVGFCCWPYGVGYAIVNGGATKEQRRSYCLGVCSMFFGSVLLNLGGDILDSNFWNGFSNALSVF